MNALVGTDPRMIVDAVRRFLDGGTPPQPYRTSFDIDWSRPTDMQVIEHARQLSARPKPLRLNSPVLIAFGVHEAANRGLPVQLHVGFGDRDLDLHRTDPMLLLPLLRAMTPVPVLLLHCYPFQRQAVGFEKPPGLLVAKVVQSCGSAVEHVVRAGRPAFLVLRW